MNAGRQQSTLRNLYASMILPNPKPIVSENPPKKQKKSKERIIPYKKKKITGALREAVWIKEMGRQFEGKCPVSWCPNTITVFDFQSGHNIPESKGGSTTLPNLIPICARCNGSMGNKYTIDEWNSLHKTEESEQSIQTPLEKKSGRCFPWVSLFSGSFFRRHN